MVRIRFSVWFVSGYAHVFLLVRLSLTLIVHDPVIRWLFALPTTHKRRIRVSE